MNTLERALIEKVGRENGWENIIESHEAAVVFASARHKAQVTVNPSNFGNLFFKVSSMGFCRKLADYPQGRNRFTSDFRWQGFRQIRSGFV